MRFLDDHRKQCPDFFIELDLEQSLEKIQQDITELCTHYEPEVLVAEGREADHLIPLLQHLSFTYGAVILKHPTLTAFPLQQLRDYVARNRSARYAVRFVLSQDHPQFSALAELFVMLDEQVDFEQHVRELLNTYFLIGMNEE